MFTDLTWHSSATIYSVVSSPLVPRSVKHIQRALCYYENISFPKSRSGLSVWCKVRHTWRNNIQRLYGQIRWLLEHINGSLCNVRRHKWPSHIGVSTDQKQQIEDNTYSYPSKKELYISLSWPTRIEWKFVATHPGRSASTRISVPLSSFRKALVKASWHALLAWYTASPGNGGTSRPVTEVIFKIVPAFRRSMEWFSTAWAMNMYPLMLVLFIVKMSETFNSGNGLGAPRARPACTTYITWWFNIKGDFGNSRC